MLPVSKQFDPFPHYNQAIVLNLSDEVVWLELTNYGEVLLKYGPSDKVITLKVGFTDQGKAITMLSGPSTSGNLLSISEWLDVLDIIKFQQSVLEYWSLNKNPPKILTRDASYDYIKPALIKAFGAIGDNKDGAFLPSDPNGLSTDILTWLKSFSKTHYLRSNWTTISMPVDNKSERIHKYKGETPGLLNPENYASYEDLGFTGYLPQLKLVLQEQRGEIINPVTGCTNAMDARKITPVESKLIIKVPAEVNPTGENPFQPVFDQIDRGIQQQSGTSQSSSSSNNPTPGTLHSEIDRINCYGFRGDKRDPIEISGRGGFFPNVTRTDETYEPEKQKQLDAVRKKKKKSKKDGYLSSLLELNILHLGNYIKNETFGGFVSTTKSVSIAKSFSGAWMEGAYFSARQYPGEQERTPITYHSQNFCYAMKCIGGFVLPSDKGNREELQAIHQFASKAEQEIAVPGMIGWNEVVGFRMCCYQKTGPFLAGPVWLSESLRSLDRLGFRRLYSLLSGKSQGSGEKIEKVYQTDPWEKRNISLPTINEVK
jgi:hypothetical protein